MRSAANQYPATPLAQAGYHCAVVASLGQWRWLLYQSQFQLVLSKQELRSTLRLFHMTRPSSIPKR
ncbi:MAG: hypothetical protein EOO60_04960 [Hymenobacter sp.]|nr:MAG: hypothetical protein EOO60_04960 [Hymenobacter sp.]